MITDAELFAMGERRLKRAEQQPDADAASRDMLIGALLMLVFEGRRIANNIADIKALAVEDKESDR